MTIGFFVIHLLTIDVLLYLIVFYKAVSKCYYIPSLNTLNCSLSPSFILIYLGFSVFIKSFFDKFLGYFQPFYKWKSKVGRWRSLQEKERPERKMDIWLDPRSSSSPPFHSSQVWPQTSWNRGEPSPLNSFNPHNVRLHCWFTCCVT